MLFAITRSSYICAQCRCHVLRNVAPGLLRLSLVTNSRRNYSTSLAGGAPGPKPKRGDISDDYMDSMVDSLIENVFSNTSLPRRPAPGIGKTDNQRSILQALPDTWEEAGVRPVVAKALLDAYPNTIRPTEIQKRILRGLKAGNSVAVRDLPGTGKSFAIAAWVLGLERAMRREPDQESSSGLSPTTTAFIFVPNADLGIQYYLMIKNLLLASSSQAISSSLDSFVQLLHRRVDNTESQINLLSEKPNPHIIIATPTAALDIISDKSDSVNGLLDFSRATAFVLDEFDALIPRTHPSWFRGRPTPPPGIRSSILTPPPSSTEILLDWVFKRRKMEALTQEVKPVQPQLVLSSATLSTLQMAKFIQAMHSLWIGHEEMSSPSLYDLPKASHLLAIGDESSEKDKIVRAVADNIVHHAVAYDISSGFMRDAPIPRTGLWETEYITKKLEELKLYEAENAESSFRAKALKRERDSLALMPLESWDTSSSRAKRAGYPPDTAAEALQTLLEHDKWPRNAIAAIAEEASVRTFIEECAKLRINARELTVDNWNRDMEKEGRIPIGRTDMLFDPKIREYYKERNERDACRDETIIWVAASASARGLDVPGVFHLYILHRLKKAREYTTYCGRVAKWPFPTLEKDIKDPRSFGGGVRRGVGKVVSLLLEDHVAPALGLEASSVGPQIIANDGSDRASWSWLESGLMVAKIGCHFQDYYGKAGEYPCGPEARTPKLIRPGALLPAPGRTFKLLDAALGPDPLKEPSPDPAPSGLFGPPQEQPKRASEEAQPGSSTDLPDMWSLPFPDGSSKPREEPQQPTRNVDNGDDVNLRSALMDPAPPSQAPGFPLFRSPQEDFRADRHLHHAQEMRVGRLPAKANNAGDGYREPLTKSPRGRGRGPGRSKALGRASVFDMLALRRPGAKCKSPREYFPPDPYSDSSREKEEKMLSLKTIDAEEGYQKPPSAPKVCMDGVGPIRAGRPKKSNKDREKDFDATLLPLRKAEVEPPESVRKVREERKALKKAEVELPESVRKVREERKALKKAEVEPPESVRKVREERKALKIEKEAEKKKKRKKAVAKTQRKAGARTGTRKAKKPRKASKRVSKEVPKTVSKKVSKEEPKKALEKVSKAVPKKGSKKVSKEEPKKASEKVSKAVPKKGSKKASKEG